MKGRHTSGDDGRRWAPNAKQAALGIAPIAALLIAVGAGGAGLLTDRANLAGAGAAAGAAGVVAQRASSRSNRRRLRSDRNRLRAQIRDLDAAVARLTRELGAQPSVLRPGPTQVPTTPGFVPVAADRSARPVASASLPVLDPGVGAAALPGQRAPATPITGLHLPPVEEPSLPRLAPGPGTPVLRGAAVPVLEPGPREALSGRRRSLPDRTDTLDLALIGNALQNERDARPPRDHAEAPAAAAQPARGAARAAVVVDLRSVPDRAAGASTLSSRAPTELDGLVHAAIAAATADELTLTLEDPAGRAAGLFEPAQGPVELEPVQVDDAEMRRLAEAARTAAREMRPGLPPSPYFTPGAFDVEVPQVHRDTA